MNWFKIKIANWLKLQSVLARDLGYEENMPKIFGESKGVTFEKSGLVKTFCTAHKWANGDGFDLSWQTENEKWVDKRVELHEDELETMLAALEHLGYFEI